MSGGNDTKYQNETTPIQIKKDSDGFSFSQTLLLILCVVSSIILISTVIYYVIRKKSLEELRHRLVPLYHFDPGECEDWEDDLLNESRKDKSKNTFHKTNEQI